MDLRGVYYGIHEFHFIFELQVTITILKYLELLEPQIVDLLIYVSTAGRAGRDKPERSTTTTS